MIITVIYFINILHKFVLANECSDCPTYIKHYKELGCRPVFNNLNDCCPTRYECPKFLDFDRTKCHYRGRVYEQGDKLPDSSLLDCTQSCKCISFHNISRFICEPVLCIESSARYENHCVFQRSLDECCSISIECDKNKIDSMHKCHVDGLLYKQGEVIYPWNDQCYSCICDKNFNNLTSIGNNVLNCKENKNCNIELHSLNKFQRGCAPVYYGTNPCCPSSWRCPETNDFVIKSTEPSKLLDSSDICEFDSLKLAKNDKLNDKCLNCSCVVPPLLSCTQIVDC